jgi:hypothetical protein
VIVKNPNNVNDSVTFTAQVNVGNGSNKPGGSITFTYNSGLAIPECPLAVAVDQNGVATCTTTSLPAGGDTVNAVYSGDNNFKGSNFSVPEAVQDYSLAVSGPPLVSGTPTATVTQGFTTASDPFAPTTITVSPTSIQGFAGTTALACTAAVQSAQSEAVVPGCTFASQSLPIAASGAQQSAGLVIDATKASPGLYAVTVTGTDQATGLVRSAAVFNVFVSATGGPLDIASGATTGNSGAINFLLPANVSLSDLICVSVSGTGIAPPGVAPSTLSMKCTFNPATVAAATSQQSASVQVTVATTTGGNATAASRRRTNLLAAGLLGIPIFGLLGLLRGRKSARSIFLRTIAILAICTGAYQLTGCGGSFQKPASSGGQTPPGSYVMLIQGTGSDGHTYKAILQVNVTL